MFKLFYPTLIISALFISSAAVAAENEPEVSNIAFNKLAAPNAAQFLEWITDNEKGNLCGGHYLETPSLEACKVPVPVQGTAVNITAKKTAFLSEYGESQLYGDVTITQPGREIIAQKATLYRNAQTGEVTNGALFGNVHFREYGKLMVANTGDWDFKKKIITLNHAIYHTTTASPTGAVSAWGRAKQAIRDALGIWHLHSVSYSTCPPTNNSWDLTSSNLMLNRDEGWGSSMNTLLYVKDVPVFYLPYFRFPIDKRRKSGFLYPALGYSNQSGTNVAIPYYFNLAPNYDFTLTPHYYSKRGLLTDGKFRYLTENSNGFIAVGYIPHDSEFNVFRDAAPQQYTSTSYAVRHALSRLENAQSSRGFVNLHHQNFFNQHWDSQLDLNYVSDDYFLRDFSSVPTTRDTDQLLNQLNVNYLGENWQFLGRVQAFQTLHLLTQPSMAVDQYQRLPQLDLNGDFPEQKYGFNYQLSTELVNFDHNRDFATGQAVVTGQRANVQPGVDWPFNWSSFYVDPKLQVPATAYVLKQHSDVTRALPIFSVDSGMFFNRELNFFSQHYTQTLEPRIFYLFVPLYNQKGIPLFDTYLPPFNAEQLFRTNRFSGLDRIGDANQISVALTTRFLDSYTAEEKMRATIGQIYQFKRHRICVDLTCVSDPLAGNNFSPFVGDIDYHINPYWSTKADVAWDANTQRISTGNIGVSYNQASIYIFNVGYNFVRNGDPAPAGHNSDLQRVNTSLSWLLKERWHAIGSWNYNLSHQRPETYLYGLQYDNCCWAMRLVQGRAFIGIDAQNHNQYDNSFYLQFLLKGLGNVGTSDAGSLLTSSISGYHDDFAAGLKF